MRKIINFMDFVLIGLLVVSSVSKPLQAAIPTEERAALIAFYNATNGDNWDNNSGWKTPPLHTDGFAMPGTEDTWYGISVSGDHVTIISVLENNLNGIIPSELGNLSGLKVLQLSVSWFGSNLEYPCWNSNQLSGSIPPELGNLINLENLNLSGNYLSGSIPPELGNLGNLKQLDLYSNQFSGGIPPELGNLSNLLEFDLDYNQLSGSIPPELGNLGNLKQLDLHSNQLSGGIPPELGNLSNLKKLILFTNQLSGNIPPELGNLSNLLEFDLNYNQLSGSIPTELGNLSNLKVLLLGDNQLSGSVPPELGNLSNLEILALSSNQLCGSIPPELVNLSNLEGLLLDYNQLSGSIPSELGNLSNLETLSLKENQLSGGIPTELGNLSALIHLYLSGNLLSGSIPAELGNLSNLWCLDLRFNQLNDSIPPELGNLNNLSCLYLSSNQLSGSIPAKLGNLSDLWELDLSFNQLSGSIPKELGNLNNLWYLYLNFNHLIGNIPKELGYLSRLRGLDLNGNQLSGEIPSSMTNLTYLQSDYTDIGYNGLYTNNDTLRTYLTSIDWDWEDTQTIAPANISAHTISPSSIRISWTPITYTEDTGGYKVYYSDSPGSASSYTYSGITADKSASSYDVTGLSPGITYYLVVKTQTNPHSNNDNTVVSEYSEEVCATTGLFEEKDPPFGSFDTPIDGSTVCSSIPVTGWALDETGIDSIKIYREQGNGLVYIGDALIVEGARPDVAAAYPDYPNNTKAGWGYMMLTNFLPNSGNGTFVIHAIATDVVGKTTTLGTKTIICDNANAVKPFGAIDTPNQGGTASGSSFVNWGWALTPQPNYIPTDGSTIRVFVDSVELGYPTYNIYREDIAFLFPGYANSSGAIGYCSLDTTAYANGVHTIFWTATDNAGNTDGIGSRYFSIQNSQRARSTVHGADLPDSGAVPNVSNIPIDYSIPVRVKKGYRKDIEPQEVLPDENGMNRIVIKELEWIELHLDDSSAQVEFKVEEKGLKNSKFIIQNSKFYSGYQITGNQLKSLPIGSTMEAQKGIFYWQPGPGFIGEYHLLFIVKEPGGDMIRKNILVTIIPKFKIER